MSEEKNSVVALFPGQGSQKIGMGKDFYDSSETAKEYFDIADKTLGFSLSQICFEGPEEELKKTAHVQPAILTVSTICYEIARQKLGDSLDIKAAAGHSLGEYSALVAAGVIGFKDAVKLVHKRGIYMQEAVAQGAGKMVAVIGKEITDIEEALEKADGVAEIANINAPGQIVVAGAAAAIDEFMKIMEGARLVELPVSAPFHCSLMKPAEEKLSVDLDALEFKAPAFPIYSNVTAKAETDPAALRENLKTQVCGQVRWVECMQNALSDTGVETVAEFGSGNILAGLMKRIDKKVGRTNYNSLSSIG